MKQKIELPHYIILTTLVGITLAACSGDRKPSGVKAQPQIGMPNEKGDVVKSRATFRITTDGANNILAVSRIQPEPMASHTPEPSPLPSTEPTPAPTIEPSPTPSTEPSPVPSPTPTRSGTQDVTVTNAPNTVMTLDNSEWSVPTIQNGVVDFGYLAIGSLMDNNLRVCGVAGNERCNTALIRTYTIGTAGPGIWNEVDQYGAPISASLAGTPPTGTVGLNAENAVVLQSMAIPPTKYTLKLSDFVPTPRYNFLADFTEAGAGVYTTTLVIEYVLTQ